jgi:hypothetical protein
MTIGSRDGYSIEISDWKPRSTGNGTVRGYCSVTVPQLGLKIFGVSIHRRDAREWTGMPERALLDASQHWRTDHAGRLMSEPTLAFFDRRARDAFSTAVLAALRRRHPHALSDSEGAAP